MKLSQMLIQGVWESKSTFLMLPHISQENLRHFNTKKVHFAYFNWRSQYSVQYPTELK